MVVKEGQRARIRVVLEASAPLEEGDGVVLRAQGNTIAAGKIERAGG